MFACACQLDISNSMGWDGKCWCTGVFGYHQPLLFLGANEQLSEYILKTNFNNYTKGTDCTAILSSLPCVAPSLLCSRCFLLRLLCNADDMFR